MPSFKQFYFFRYVNFNISIFLLMGLFLISACMKDDKASAPPLLSFISDSGFVSRDTVLNVGQQISVGIDAEGEAVNITYLHVGWDNGRYETILDSGLNNPGLRYERTIIKSSSDTETWTFMVMDRDRNTSTIDLTLQKSASTQWGEIITYMGIILGAQDNPGKGGFFSLHANRSYFLDEAFLLQDSIDFIYYYDVYEGTFSSPNEDDAPAIFPGPTGLDNWTVKNESRYGITTLLPVDFEQAGNDSLILSAYDPGNLKRKAKYLAPGMVISCNDPSGRLGLIHIEETSGTNGGFIKMSVKIQKQAPNAR